MKTDERIELLREAQEKLAEAIDLIEDAVAGSLRQGNVEAYIVDHLRIMATADHGFVSRDLNLDNVIKGLREDEAEGMAADIAHEREEVGWLDKLDEWRELAAVDAPTMALRRV